MTEIFISHCPKDRQLAETMCGFLTQRGYVCMTSSGFDARGGYSSRARIDALSSMKVFILIYSRNSASSPRVSRQLELALNKPGTVVMPYRTDNAPITANYSGLFMATGCIDAYPANNDMRLEQLYTAVSGIINVTAPAPGQYAAVQFRPIKDTAPTNLLAACAVILVGGVIAVTAVRQVNTKLRGEPKPAPAVTQEPEPEPEPARETATFPCKVIYIDHEYSGEYSGEVGENGLPDGTGEFRWTAPESESNRSFSYSGEFAGGAITGKGTSSFDYDDGASYVYEGYFESGMMKGRGVCTFFDDNDKTLLKSVSEGLWYSYDNISDFKKTEYYADGMVREFRGELINNFWSGSGTLRRTYTTGDIKEELIRGTWTEGELEGQIVDTQQYTNGDHFEFKGNYSGGHWNGEGVKIYYYASNEMKNEKYEGTWVDGRLSGPATKTVNYANGDVRVYQGTYDNGSLAGHVTKTHTYASGKLEKKVYEGEWSNCNANGKGVQTKYYRKAKEDDDTVTTVTEGVWTDGVLSGEVTSTETLVNGDVKVFKGEYADNYRNGSGVLTYTYAKGDIKNWVIEGSWANDKLTDTAKKTVTYKNGDREEYSGGYSHSKKNGEGTTVFTEKKSGKKWVEEGAYADDRLTDGTRTYYGKDGAVESTEKYIDGALSETK